VEVRGRFAQVQSSKGAPGVAVAMAMQPPLPLSLTKARTCGLAGMTGAEEGQGQGIHLLRVFTEMHKTSLESTSCK